MSSIGRVVSIVALVGIGFIGGLTVHEASAHHLADQPCASPTPTSEAIIDVETPVPTAHHQWVPIAKWRVPNGYDTLREFESDQDMPLGQAYAVKIQAPHPVVDKFYLQMPIDYSAPGGAAGSYDPVYSAHFNMFVKIKMPPKTATSWGVNLWLESAPSGTTMTLLRWQN